MKHALADLIRPDTTPFFPHLYIDTLHLRSFSFNATKLNKSSWTRLKYSIIQCPIPNEQVYPTGEYTDSITSFHVQLWKNHLSFQFSLPKLIHGHNRTPAPLDSIDILIKYLDRLRSRLGLQFNIDDLRVSRIDVFQDITIPGSVAVAISELRKLQSFSRMKQYYNPTAYNNSYLRWNNSLRELVVYDKSKEAAEKHKIDIPPNLFRFETRLMRADVCVKAGFSDLTSLRDPIRQRSFLHETLGELLDAAELNKLRIEPVEVDTLEEFQRHLMTSRVDEILLFVAGRLAYQSLLDILGGEHCLERFLDINIKESHKKSNVKKKIAQMKAYFEKPHSENLDIWRLIEATISELEPPIGEPSTWKPLLKTH
jgi:hypothetical protein